MSTDIEQKQQFLREEILSAGYDPNNFIQFMNKQNPTQSITLQNLTMEQLKQIVQLYKIQVEKNQLEKQYKNYYDRESAEIIKIQQLKIDTKTNDNLKNKQSEDKQNKIVYYDKQGTFDYQTKGIANCKKIQKQTKVDQILVTIPKMEIKVNSGIIFGLGAKTECYYFIQTNLTPKPIKRLAQDFQWLNSTLLKLFPHILIPQLEPLKKDVKDPYLLRQKQLQQYLQHLAKKKILTNSRLFLDFLQINHDKIQQYKKMYDLILNPSKGISSLQTQQGTIQIDLSNQTRKFYNISKKFSQKTSQLHNSINQSINKMIQTYRIAIDDTYKVVDQFAQLHDAFTQISLQFKPFQKQEYKDILINLNNLFLGIGDSLQDITNSLDKHLKDYNRFQCGLDRSLTKLQKQLKTTKQQHIQFKQTLKRKKQKIINDPTRWQLDTQQLNKKYTSQQLMKIILPKQNIIENQNKIWYAFILKNYQKQVHNYVQFITKRYRKVYVNLSKDLLNSNKKYVESIAKFITQNQGNNKQQNKK